MKWDSRAYTVGQFWERQFASDRP